MAVVKLKAGETVLVTAVGADLKPRSGIAKAGSSGRSRLRH